MRMEWLGHKLQLVCSSVFGALLFIGFVFVVREKARKLKYRSLYENVENQMMEYTKERFQQQEAVLSTLANAVKEKKDQLTEEIIQKYPPSYSFQHHSVYYGSCGLAFLFWRLYRAETRSPTLRDKYILLAKQYAETAGKFYTHVEDNPTHPTQFTCGFLFGQSGYYTMRALIHHLIREEDTSEDFLQKLVLELHKATEIERHNPNMMYGSSGYLSCCVFLREHIPSFPPNIIPILFGYLVSLGEEEWRKMQSHKALIDREAHKRLGFIYPPHSGLKLVCWMNRVSYGRAVSWVMRPVLWTYFKLSVWNEPSELFGMLRGNMGTMYQLLACPELVHSSREATVLLRNSLEFLLQLHNDNGFLPSGILPIHHDAMKVQWCNGVSGFGMLFARAFEVFQDERYIEIAKETSNIVWEKGLLRKGEALCHGTAGNGYLFLTLYRITKEDKYLYRARCFAQYIISQKDSKTCDYSLFEGTAGTIIFLSDILDPLHSHFPILEDSV